MKRVIFFLSITLAMACSDKPSPTISVNDQGTEHDMPSVDMPTDLANDEGNTDQGTPDLTDMMPDIALDMTPDMTADMENTDADMPDMENPPNLACEAHSDCSRCAFPTAPTTLSECYCVSCASEVLPAETCQENQAAWDAVCGTDTSWEPNGACPIPRCTPPQPVACINDTCIDACTQAECPVLNCPLNEQILQPGECCPRCSGPNTCTVDSECGLCNHASAPTSPSECECPLCPTHPATQTECQARNSAFNTHCDADFLATCPVAICLPTQPANCANSGYCEASSDVCVNDGDCGYCPFASAPTDPSECVCEGCGTPMTNDACSAIIQQVNIVCAGFDFDGCIPTPCPSPPELTCDAFGGGTCEMDI